ncbi:MAG: hypothetical protein GX418_04650 [Clostridiales bacterium]|nr:hypothetical protein [Clostridiales bacterium]
MGDRLRALGLVASVGRSDADYPEALAAVAHGHTPVTHPYGGMSMVRRKPPAVCWGF